MLKITQNGGKGRSRTAAASKMEHFVIIVNGGKPLIIITKSSILDVAADLDPPLEGLWKLCIFALPTSLNYSLCDDCGC